MPRNPNKRHCQMPGCRSWAMRALNHCRSHSDQQLGSRGAGAPRRNINALKTGEYAGPFSREELRQLALQIAQSPEHLPQHLDPAIQSIHRRSNSPVASLTLLGHLFEQLALHVSDNLFTTQLDAYLHDLPPADRPGARAIIWKHALPRGPLKRLQLLQGIVNSIPAKKQSGTTINGTTAGER